MKPEEITSLAREYAEKVYAEIEDVSLKEHLIVSLAKGAEDSFRFLLRRYALVERSKLEELKIAHRAKEHGAVWLNQWEAKSLFPEIAKEVEG